MWNLIKNTFRSLRHNKVAIIGLTFLTFLSMGIFTLLTSTTNNINSEYNKISISGKLHDFTVSELYNIGQPIWKYTPECTGKSSDNQNVPWPNQTGTVPNITRQYSLTFDGDNTDHNTEVYAFWLTHNTDSAYSQYFNFDVTVSNSSDSINYETGDHVSSMAQTQIMSELAGLDTHDMTVISGESSKQTQSLLNEASTTDTPIQNYMSDMTSGLGNQIEYRQFKSMDIDNSPDNIFYKVVQSNPIVTDDTTQKDVHVDEVTTFDNVPFNNNFAIEDFNPLQDNDDLKNISINDAFGFKLPLTFPSSNADPQYNELFARFKIMDNGTFDDSTIKDLVHKLVDDFDKDVGISTLSSDYNAYYSAHGKNESVYLKGYRTTIDYMDTSPHIWYLDNWTSKMSIVVPEYMQRHNLHPINESNYVNEPSYIAYAADPNHQILDRYHLFIGWMNSLKQEKIDTWINGLPNSVKVNVGGGTPYVILNSGITADFIYPIVNIQHPTPNPERECIIFANTYGYSRVTDGFRGNPTENYLVGRTINGSDINQIISNINAKALTTMIWPKGINAAYTAFDTTNTLNASAFRIVFIPQLISKINTIDYLLTIFVIILSLLISTIILRRYITANRVEIGIMQANGVHKYKIAVSLTPFALLPAAAGGISGYLVGTLLQGPAIGLFKSYWMLPTPLVAFSWVSLVVAIIVPFIIFTSVSILATYWLLREKTVNLMKTGSEYKTNIVSRAIKKPFAKFGIMTRFRVSVAFNSLWKLGILCVMVALSMSSLVFGLSINGKFNESMTKTFASRNYSYAVDLMSPTSQAGQYVPIDANNIGETGWVNSPEGVNFIPNMYGSQIEMLKNSGIADDESYQQAFQLDSPSNDPIVFYPPGITDKYESNAWKQYYDLTYLTDLVADGGNWYPQSLAYPDSQTSNYHWYGNLFVPMLSDSMGQNTDLMYMKDRSMTRTTLDYTVGVAALHLQTNPWNIAATLMPENNKNLCDRRSDLIIQKMGEKACWGKTASTSEHKEKNLYGYTSSTNDWFNLDYDKYFDITSRISPDDDQCPYTFTINKNNNTVNLLGASLSSAYTEFLISAYNTFNIRTPKMIDGNYDPSQYNEIPMLEQDYTLQYNKVPMEPNDETYTYLTTTNTSAKIIGIKTNSQYIELNDINGNDLKAKLPTTKTNDDIYPIVVNAYAAHKHNLNIGSIISFDINNGANRYQNELREQTVDNNVKFRVVGINTTYEGEEYFINQQVANYILGLRYKFDNVINSGYDMHIHNWYLNNDTSIGAGMGDGASLTNASKWDFADVSNWHKDQGNVDTPGNVVPYGFNGVFTNKDNGGSLLSNGIIFYSPSGIYPGNDLFTSDAVRNILKYGANLQLASEIIGAYTGDANDPQWAQDIHSAYETWINSSISDQETKHNDFVTDVNIQNLINALTKTFGTSSVFSLVSGAVDRDSTQLIFTDLASTVNQIEYLVLAIISLMVIIIVMLISIMLIGESKRLAAILKSLGYSDVQNAISFLAIYIPVILIGLAIAIPLSMGLVYAFQSIIFNWVNILLTTNIKWWYYLVGIGAVGVVLTVSAVGAYNTLRKERLIDLMK